MYRIKKLQKFPGLFHAFSTKADGNMANVILGKKADFERVFVNRQKFLKKIGVNINYCVCMWVLGKDSVQEAGVKDLEVSMKDYKKAVKVDALVIGKKKLFIFLLTADCAPVILYDPVKKAVGVAHVGWKGADLNITGKVVASMKELYNTKPKNLVIGIGPSARSELYIKKNPSQRKKKNWTQFINSIGEGNYQVDFVGLCKKQLIDCGVTKDNIYDCNINTIKDKRFFSHYRDRDKDINKQGRFACVVGLR